MWMGARRVALAGLILAAGCNDGSASVDAAVGDASPVADAGQDVVDSGPPGGSLDAGGRRHDAGGELYILTETGEVYRIVADEAA